MYRMNNWDFAKAFVTAGIAGIIGFTGASVAYASSLHLF